MESPFTVEHHRSKEISKVRKSMLKIVTLSPPRKLCLQNNVKKSEYFDSTFYLNTVMQ